MGLQTGRQALPSGAESSKPTQLARKGVLPALQSHGPAFPPGWEASSGLLSPPPRPRPCPSSQPGPPGADVSPGALLSALCILVHRFSHNLDKVAYSFPKAAVINHHKGEGCEGSSRSFSVGSLGALRGSPPVWLADVLPTPRERLRETRAEVTPGHLAYGGMTAGQGHHLLSRLPPTSHSLATLGLQGQRGTFKVRGLPCAPQVGP